MPGGVRVTAGREFRDVARALKAAGQGGLRRELTKGMKAGAKPIVDEAQRRVRGLAVSGERASGGGRGGASARAARAAFALAKRKSVTDRMKRSAHKRSGLRATVARSVAAKVRTGSRTAGLTVRAYGTKMPADQASLPMNLNKGRWKHPVFGNKKNWVWQVAPRAWFDDATKAKGPEVRDNTARLVEEYVQKIID